MANPLTGSITILFCAAGYIISYRLYKAGRINTALGLLILCGLLLRIFTAADFYIHPWDERFHALVAKNLIEDPLRPTLYQIPLLPYDYTNWTNNHIWLHKQPLPLWTMAFSLWTFGINEIALRLPSIILSTLGIAVTYKIAYSLFNTKVAFIAAFLYSIHGLIIEMTAGRVTTDHIDIFFLFFIQLAVLLSIKFFRSNNNLYNLLCGISIGFAILSKWLPALIVLPIWILLAYNSSFFNFKKTMKDFLILISMATIISLPWQIYIFHYFPAEAQWESVYNVRHLTEGIEGHAEPFYFYADKIRIIFGELIYLPLIWFLFKAFKKPGNLKRMVLVIWLMIPLIFFSFAATKMQGYILFTAPAIFIITALFWTYLYTYRNRFKNKWLSYILLFLLIALPVRYSIERIKPFADRDRNPAWARELKALNSKISNFKKVVIFNAEKPIATMFYSNSIAYPHLPDIYTLEKLKEDGYLIYIRKKQREVNELMNNEIYLQDSQIYYKEWR